MKFFETLKLKYISAKIERSSERQLSKNDCGVSVIKSICQSLNKNVTRRDVLKKIPIDEMGVSFDAMKQFLNTKDISSRYAVISDIETSTKGIKNCVPCVAMIKVDKMQHFIYLAAATKSLVLVMDPAVGSYEIKPWSYVKSRLVSSKSIANEELLSIQMKEYANHFLERYNLLQGKEITRVELVELYNKIKYFHWFSSEYGFTDEKAERQFLQDLLEAEERRSVPSKFRAMRLDSEQLSIKSPIVLALKDKISFQPKIKNKVGKNNGSGRSNIAKLFSFLLADRASRMTFSALLLIGMFASLIAYSAIYANQILVDEVIPQRHVATLYVFASVLFFFRFSEFILQLFKSFSEVILNQLLDRKLFTTFEHILLSLETSTVKNHTRGDLTQRANDVLRIKGIVSKYINNIVISTIICIFSMLMLFYFGFKIAALIVVIGLFYLYVFKRFSNYIRQIESARFTEKGILLSSIIEKIEGHSVIKRTGSENDFLEDDEVKLDRYLAIQKKGQLATYLLVYIPRFVAMLGSIIVIVMAGRMHLIDGSISLGQILTIVMLSELTFTSLRMILSTQLQLQEQLVVVERFFDFCEQPIYPKDEYVEPTAIKRVELKSFRYSFPNSSFTLSIDHLNIESNERVLVSGTNGSGKTTLLNTLGANLNLEDCDGHIHYYDEDSLPISKDQANNQTYLVRAEDKIFNDTIQFNVTLNHNSDQKAIYKLARLIGADDFISPFQMPLDTVLHENGDNLSTGQRRKLLVMRAILSHSSIIIFDEIFRGIDVESKSRIFRVLNGIKNKIMIFTTHEDISELNITREVTLKNGQITFDQAFITQTVVNE